MSKEIETVVGRLTAKEIEQLDQWNNENESCEQGLKIAMNFYMNHASELRKVNCEWWERVRNRLGCDPAIVHKTKRHEGEVVVVRIEKAD